MRKMGKAKINAENIEMARKKYYQYCVGIGHMSPL